MDRTPKIYLAFPIRREKSKHPRYGAIAGYLSSRGKIVSNHKNGYEAYENDQVP